MNKGSHMGTGEPLNLPGEEWRDVVGVPGFQVSNLGRIKSLARVMPRFNKRWNCESPLTVQEKILKLSVHKYRPRKNGQFRIRDNRPAAIMVTMQLNKVRHWRYLHHVVLEAFVGPRPEGMECCHHDGNAANNRLKNLRWGTSKENKADAIRLNQFWPKQRGSIYGS